MVEFRLSENDKCWNLLTVVEEIINLDMDSEDYGDSVGEECEEWYLKNAKKLGQVIYGYAREGREITIVGEWGEEDVKRITLGTHPIAWACIDNLWEVKGAKDFGEKIRRGLGLGYTFEISWDKKEWQKWQEKGSTRIKLRKREGTESIMEEVIRKYIGD